MAMTKIRREVTTTIADVTFGDGEHKTFYLYGAYSAKRAKSAIAKVDSRSIVDLELNMDVQEYEMSLEDFVKHATLKN